ncbi:hypothetical protein, partial [Chryseobacterium sp. SIMBA_029]|uniref:hypothetical protein n=1 Tax=Chryseobacterium sp. SIMBA_029 TaxID=3085772 RepID=UPI00397AB8D1
IGQERHGEWLNWLERVRQGLDVRPRNPASRGTFSQKIHANTVDFASLARGAQIVVGKREIFEKITHRLPSRSARMIQIFAAVTMFSVTHS